MPGKEDSLRLSRGTNRVKFILLIAAMFLLGALYIIVTRYYFPRSDVTVTHEIGWWAYQDKLNVKSFEVRLIDQRFGVDKRLGIYGTSEALVEFTIEGELLGQRGSRPFVREIHIAESVLDTNGDRMGVFGLTPIVDVKTDQLYAGETSPFQIKVQYIIRALQWGNNQFEFTCGRIQRNLSIEKLK